MENAHPRLTCKICGAVISRKGTWHPTSLWCTDMQTMLQMINYLRARVNHVFALNNTISRPLERPKQTKNHINVAIVTGSGTWVRPVNMAI